MADQDELRVRGGAGGVRAQLEDISRVGELLRAAGGGLAEQGRAVTAIAVDPGLRRTAVGSPVTFARAEAALARAALGPSGLFAVAARMQGLGSEALAVAQGYRTADGAVAGTLRAASARVGQAVGLTAGALTPGLVVGSATAVNVLVRSDAVHGSPGRRQAQPEPLRALGGFLLHLLADHARLTEAAVPVLSGLIGGFSATVPAGPLITARAFGRPGEPADVAEIATGLGTLGGLAGATTGGDPWFRDRSQIQVRAVPVRWPGPASGSAELLGRIPEQPGDRPRIHLERIDGLAGRRWVVSVPGTADWSPVPGRTPFDLSGDLRLMAGGRSAGTAAVVAAMRRIGVRKGEPVLLVGHSQGGLIAAAIAADPVLRREFSVSHVLTSGAPVASIPVPDQVQMLSIEHSDDLVPSLDGRPNPDRPNWITVTARAPADELPAADRAEPLLAHRAELYRSTAERVDRSSDPSLVRWRSGLAPFLAGVPAPDPGHNPAPIPSLGPNPIPSLDPSLDQGSGAGWDVEVTRLRTR